MEGKGLKEFFSKLKQDSVRFAYQFQISFTSEENDSIIQDLDDIQFFAQSASLPGKTIETSEVFYQGVTLRVPNNVTFESPWTINLRCDEDMKVFKTIEKWNSKYADLTKGGGGDKRIPPFNARIDLLDKTLQHIKETYVITGVWPENYGEITLDQSDNSITVFDVALAYQYYYNEASGDPLK